MSAEELIDVLDDKGQKTGEILSKREIHAKGLWHGVSHIWILNPKGELLIQKRSMAKDTSPGMWDVSVGGHLSAGDDAMTGAVREINEEIGVLVDATELEFLDVITSSSLHKEGSYINKEFQNVFLVRKDIPLQSITLQVEEVDDVKYIYWRELKALIAAEDPLYIKHPQEYTLLFRYLEERGI